MRLKPGEVYALQEILIVDDDQTIRDGLYVMIRSFAQDAVIHMAGNGEEALAKICSSCVGLIFTDIKMPVMGGLELLEKLAQMEYRGESVVISGFDDFDFVRQAMRLGASDYLLKPVSTQELKAVYEACMRRIRLKTSRFGLRGASAKSQMEEIYAQQALAEQLLSDPVNVQDYLKDHGMPRVQLAWVGVLGPFGRGQINIMDKQAAYLTGISLMDKFLEEDTAWLIQGESHGLWVLLVFFQRVPEDISENLCQALHSKEIKCGAAQKLYPVEKLHDAYENALGAMEAFFYDLPGEEPGSTEEYPFPQQSDKVVSAIAACDTSGAMEETGKLFSMVCSRKPGVNHVRELFASIVYTLMNKNRDFIGIIGKYKFTDRDIVHQIGEAPTISCMKKSFLSLMHIYIDTLNEKLMSKDEYAIQRAKSYVNNNFAGNASVSELSERLGLHPNYFSSLFKHRTGQTFSDYLRSVRIKKAMELMTTTNLKVYEIACQVGYNDNAQFYRAFRQVTGVPPGQFKKHGDI
jgi:two-component system, response regulator YesN